MVNKKSPKTANKKNNKNDFDSKLSMLKKKALNSLLEQTNQLNLVPTKDNFRVVASLAKNENLDVALNILNKLLKYQTKYGDFEYKKENTTENISPVYFLGTITQILLNNKDNKKIFKKYIKPIKKALIYLEKHIDEVHLLIYKTKNGKKKFEVRENTVLISLIDGLSDILNQYGYHKQADSFFMMKGKVELGFNRYFWKQDMKILISSFDEEGDFKKANDNIILEIISKYPFDNEFAKEFITKTKPKIQEETKTINILNYLQLLNESKNKEFEKEFVKYLTILEPFPQKVLLKKQYDEFFKISKSLNSKFTIDKIELKKENKMLVNINSIKIIIKILEF